MIRPDDFDTQAEALRARVLAAAGHCRRAGRRAACPSASIRPWPDERTLHRLDAALAREVAHDTGPSR